MINTSTLQVLMDFINGIPLRIGWQRNPASETNLLPQTRCHANAIVTLPLIIRQISTKIQIQTDAHHHGNLYNKQKNPTTVHCTQLLHRY